MLKVLAVKGLLSRSPLWVWAKPKVLRETRRQALAAGNSSTEYGYIRICTNKKQEAKIPLLKVLEILKNFFQEVFKQGSGQSPEVFLPLPYRRSFRSITGCFSFDVRFASSESTASAMKSE